MKKLITCILITAALLISIPNVAHAAALGTMEPEKQPMIIKVSDDEIDILAQLVWAEARGVDSRMEQAAVVWCALNRVDAGMWGSTITEVVTAKHQFAYRPSAPVTEEMRELVADVVDRWVREQLGSDDVGRVLPEDYLYFAGRNGRNWFRQEYGSRAYWDWSLPDPYSEEG